MALVVAALVAGCGLSQPSEPSSGPASIGDAASRAPSGVAPHASVSVLVAAAQGEGSLALIGLPRDRCDYGTIIDTFKTTYDLAVTELDPGATAAEQVDALRDPSGGAAVPDVVELSISAAMAANNGALLSPFKVSTWESIPDSLKDRDGAWAADRYGVVSFETNVTELPAAPQSWAELLGRRYEGAVALAGDPRVSTQASLAVLAASIANGGSLDDASKGLEFFKKVAKAGNLAAMAATDATIEIGKTPVAIRWTDEALAHRDASAGNPQIEVTVPATGQLAVATAQAISAKARHPHAAQLWLEFLYSDQGQNLLLSGDCHPIRFDDLSAREAIPVETTAKLPETSSVVFPTVAQQEKAMKLVATDWDRVVGIDVR
jgi:putative spermidine/putrescine transport system substrate-binding protein